MSVYLRDLVGYKGYCLINSVILSTPQCHFKYSLIYVRVMSDWLEYFVGDFLFIKLNIH